MMELGKEAEKLHRQIVEEIRYGSFEKVYLCGSLFAESGKGLPVFQTTEKLAEELRKHPLKGYTILLKGSRGMAMERLEELL